MSLKSLWEKFIQNRPVYQKLRVAYERATKNLAKLQKAHKQTTAALNLKIGALVEAHAEHDQTKVALDNSQHRFQQLQTAHGALTEKNNRTATDLEQARNRVQQLQTAHEQTTADLNRTTGALDEARAEHDQTKADLDKAQHDLQQLQTAHGALTEKNDRTATDLEQARNRVQQLQTAHEQTTADLNRTTGALVEARTEHDQTKAALDNSRHRFQQLQTAHGALTEKNDQTVADLEQARNRVQQLQKAHEQTKADLNRTTGALDELRAEHDQTKAALDKAHLDLQQLRAEHERTTMELERATTALDEARAEHEQTKADLRDEQKKYNSLHEEYMQTDWPKLREEHNQTTTALIEEREKHAEKTNALNALREKHNQTKTDLTKARDNFNELDQRYKLVSDLLTPKPSENEAFKKFKKLFDGPFMAFANEENSLADEAAALKKLQSLEKRLEEIVAFPHTFMKKSIAIGGGFSSGKSEFVNSFITKPDVKMPVGIEPATAIPSFVISDPEVSIKGFSSDGATVDIAPDLYSQLSHRFVETFSFKLKRLMPSITVEVPLAEGLFENICLIDTPGYNPAGGNTDEDRKTATEVLKGRDTLIWMIGLDATGTIPQDDLDFIKDLKLPFYVVLNKADLKSLSDLEDILDEVKETLEDVGIEPEGISAYSARRRKEYLFDEDGVSLHDFFRRENQPKEEIETELRREIESVFAMYEAAIRKDEHTAAVLMEDLKTLDLDILYTRIDPDEQDVLSEKIEKIKKSQEKDFTPIKAKMEKIKKEMLEAVDEVFRSLRPQGNEAMTHPPSSNKGSAVKRQGAIKGGKYIPTTAKQLEKPSALPQEHSQSPRPQGNETPPSNKGSAVKRQGTIKGGKYIPTTAEQLEKPSAPAPKLGYSQPPKRTDKPRFENPELPSSSNVVTAHREAKISDEQASQSATEQFEQSALRFINSASADLLADEFGRLRIHSGVAKNIVAYRTRHGTFQRLDKLRRVRGIGSYTFGQLRKRLWDIRHRLG